MPARNNDGAGAPAGRAIDCDRRSRSAIDPATERAFARRSSENDVEVRRPLADARCLHRLEIDHHQLAVDQVLHVIENAVAEVAGEAADEELRREQLAVPFLTFT